MLTGIVALLWQSGSRLNLFLWQWRNYGTDIIRWPQPPLAVAELRSTYNWITATSSLGRTYACLGVPKLDASLFAKRISEKDGWVGGGEEARREGNAERARRRCGGTTVEASPPEA